MSCISRIAGKKYNSDDFLSDRVATTRRSFKTLGSQLHYSFNIVSLEFLFIVNMYIEPDCATAISTDGWTDRQRDRQTDCSEL